MSVKILLVGVTEQELSQFKILIHSYQIETAEFLTESTYQLIANSDIALVIIDICRVPEHAFELLKIIKAKTSGKNIRTMLLSDADTIEQEKYGLQLGADDCIRKPIYGELLEIRINMHLMLIEESNVKEKLKDRDLLLDAMFTQAPIGISISHKSEPVEGEGKSLFRFNQKFQQITGRSKEDLVRLGWANITHPDDVEEDLRNFRRLKAGDIDSYSMEKRYIRADNSIVWVHMVVAKLNLDNKYLYNHICLVQDITERKMMEKSLAESERSKSILLSHLPGMAYRCDYDREWTMRFVSAGCESLTGYPPESLILNRDLSFNDVIAPNYRDSLWKEWERVLQHKKQFRREYEIVTAQGIRKWVLELGQGIFYEQGKIEALEGIILDISDRKKIENELMYHTVHDMWTDLYNLRHLKNSLMFDAKTRSVKQRALVAVDLSTIHTLTKIYGFQYGQNILKNVAMALKKLTRTSRLLFNVYENHFVFYVKDYEGMKNLEVFCQEIHDRLSALLAIERIGWGIGIVIIDGHNKHDAEQLLRNLMVSADIAAANYDKESLSCYIFDSELETKIQREEDITVELTQIASNEYPDRLFLQYQPIIDIASNQICCFEALARLKSDHLGLVPPLEFIPIAEKTKLIIPIGKIIIQKALLFLSKLKKLGFDSIGISINISVIQLLKKDFYKSLLKLIDDYQVSAEDIGIEITESVFISNYQEINSVLGELRKHNIRIAIDDFGTGYSSFAHERELNIDCVKIDKFFIDKLLTLKKQEAITGDIVSLAHKLGHCVIAEGVEHIAQRRYLEEYGCDKFQGYLISRPLDEDAAVELLVRQRDLSDTDTAPTKQ
ncbi:MAG: EAL domain-containing protein [Sphaerochaetaceae bacterium]|nr:EAL domain-containing protein [Sphaerochaetaceae bacterium]